MSKSIFLTNRVRAASRREGHVRVASRREGRKGREEREGRNA
ncbi:hypothetical protein [Nostoc sp. JL33]|nr:hypothetical protein [Nostoc sp. JL33]